jgi:soluble lytic murein transglycosylase
MVLDDLGHEVLASAAYNAGPRRAQRWLDEKPLEGAIYVETIPYGETRRYVKKVMANAAIYASLLGGPRISLHARLGVIPASDADARDE